MCGKRTPVVGTALPSTVLSSGPPCYWKVHLNGSQVTALLDTGSTKSFVSKEWVARNGITSRAVWCHSKTFRAVNGATFEANNYIVLPLRILSACCKIKFLIMCSPIPVLLGTDVMNHFGVTISVNNNRILASVNPIKPISCVGTLERLPNPCHLTSSAGNSVIICDPVNNKFPRQIQY